MKKLLTTVLMIALISTCMNGQNYLNGTEAWNQRSRWYDIQTFDKYVFNKTLWLNGDTLINGKQYYKMYFHSYDTIFEAGTDVFIDASYQYPRYSFGLRDDGKKFYKFTSFDTVEQVMQDFDFELGDTASYYDGLLKLVVDSIELIDIGGGELRKVFHFDDPAYSKLYEGIGMASGIGEKPQVDSLAFSWLRCFSRNGILVPITTSTEYCNLQIIDEVASVEASAPISISPNPSQGILRLEPELIVFERMTLFDSFGRLVDNWDSPTSKEFDLSFLPNGMYFLMIKTDKGNYLLKWIKQH